MLHSIQRFEMCRIAVVFVALAICSEAAGSSSSDPPLHPTLGPLKWLVGRWRTTEGHGSFPTINNFTYTEELDISHVGQSYLQFSFYSVNSTTHVPMHREVGFIRIQPGTNKVAFINAQNIGLTDLEEGEVSGDELKLETTSIGRTSFGLPVSKLRRHFRRDGDSLEQVVEMETSKAELTQHLQARYNPV